MREDFDHATKEQLAKRAAYLCSFVGCHRSTFGPSREAIDKTANTGVAAHICAASKGPGARRRLLDLKLDRALLRKYENGIWMCETHAKLIDTDEVSYTVEMLKDWRRLAELRAEISHQVGKALPVYLREGNQVPLASSRCRVSSADADSVSMVCSVVVNSCISDVWGENLGLAVRDLAGELIRNEFTHGEASEFHLSVEINRVSIRGNGNPYSITELMESQCGRGGQLAARHLIEQDDSLIVSYRRDGDWNTVDIALISESEQVLKSTTCSIRSHDFLDMNLWNESGLAAFETCDTIYIVVPKDTHFIPSIAFALAQKLSEVKHRKFVLVGSSISPSVLEFFTNGFDNLRVMQI